MREKVVFAFQHFTR